MSSSQEKSIFGSVKSKVILGFLVAALALGASWVISKIAFENLLFKLEAYSRPDDKLRHINKVFKEIVLLDHVQNDLSSNTEENRVAFIFHSENLLLSLDTLSQLNVDSPIQIIRIDSMKKILIDREQIYDNYMEVRKKLMSNRALSKEVQKISGLITINKNNQDSTVVKTEKKVTTTTLYTEAPTEVDGNEEGKKGWINRIFKSKKSKKEILPAPPRIVKKQEVNVIIDTLKVAQKDSTIDKVGKAIHAIEKSQIMRTSRFVDREKKLAATGNDLIAQLLSVMENIEQDAIQQSVLDKTQTQGLVAHSIKRIEWVMLGFFLLTILLVYFIMSDITKSNDYRLQLEEAKEEAEYHNMAKQRFLSNMSHEIRTPLQSIIGYTELLKNAKKPKKQDLEIVHSASEHLLHLVNDILDYSRIVSNQFTFENRNFSINQVLIEVIHMLQPSATVKGIELKLINNLENNLFLISDPFRFRQILYNLLSNAIKFTEKGEVTLAASGIENKFGYKVKIEITDTGIGLSEEQLLRIFNQFEQADSSISRKYGGTGLGLSIVKSLVEGMNGTIDVSSKPQVGTTFMIQLFMKKGTPMVVNNIKNEDKSYKIPGKVWLVDDDAFILKWCASVLELNQVRYACFSSAEEALSHPWDPEVRFVLTDMRMTGMNGAEMSQRLKTKANKAVKFFALTAQALPEEQEKLMKLGFDGILMKPFHSNELMELLNIAAVEQPKPEKKGIDLSNLETMVFGDEELMIDILQQFIMDSEADKNSILTYFNENDFDAVMETAHRLSGRIGQIGDMELSSKFRKIETDIRNHNINPDTAELTSIIQQLNETMQQIEVRILSKA